MAKGHQSWKVDFATPPAAPGEGRLARSTQMIPDIWLESDGSRLPVVIDTKWKSVFSEILNLTEADDLLSSGETRTVRLRPEDLYQATAYAVEALHRQAERGELIEGCVAALVYPSLHRVPDLGREVRLGAIRIIVCLVGWNVSAAPIPEITAIWSRLQSAAT